MTKPLQGLCPPSPLRGGLAGWRACLRVYAQPGTPAGGCHQLSYEAAPLTYLLQGACIPLTCCVRSYVSLASVAPAAADAAAARFSSATAASTCSLSRPSCSTSASVRARSHAASASLMLCVHSVAARRLSDREPAESALVGAGLSRRDCLLGVPRHAPQPCQRNHQLPKRRSTLHSRCHRQGGETHGAWEATCSGSSPPSLEMRGSAPASSSGATTSTCPRKQARHSAVRLNSPCGDPVHAVVQSTRECCALTECSGV